jgi:cysteine desulfurase
MRKVYLDHAATTPVHPQVFSEMRLVLEECFGNPSSLHSFGRKAKEYLEQARKRVASLINASPEEIIFTSGGTESNNLAILGTVYANRGKGNHIITSAIEHHSVLHTCKFLGTSGFEVTFLPVDGNGLVDPDDVRKAIKRETILITIMHSNNEIGTIQPIEEISLIAREYEVPFHTDAVASVGHVPLDVDKLGVDLLSLSGHKIYGPKGVGALYIREGTHFAAVFHGGGQERRLRPGTENLPGIVGFGKAAEIARRELASERVRLEGLRDKLIQGVQRLVPDVKLNGHPVRRLPNNANFSFAGVEGESLLLRLDLLGIAVSKGSACSSGELASSHVLLAIGVDPELAQGTLRMAVGRTNTDEDIDYVLDVLPGVVAELRQMSPLIE